MNSNLVLFKGKNIRRLWDEKQEKWYFSVVDIISVLINEDNHRKAQSYWTTLKNRLKIKGSQVVTNCDQLKMRASDGKFYITDSADVEILFRLIQSVPSPKAEPIKIWLAKVGYERIQDISDPERSLNRARKYWQRMGRSKEWIQQRMLGQEIRNKLTDYR
ncbi:MAG TPA: BRO family protein [Patescibacteria group bacterium]|nr:BRO family protein [Patescibacteria group bacterium]